MKYEWKEHIYPHSDLKQLDERLWVVTGSLPKGKLPRNMIIYRMDSGGLLIHSAIVLNEDSMKQIEALGKPEILIVPNTFHRLDAPNYKARYPDIQVVCPGQARRKVEKKIKISNTVEEIIPDLGISFHTPSRNKTGEMVYELKLSRGKALIFCDLLFNLEHLPGLDGWMLKVLGSSGFFGVTRIGKFFTSDHQKLKSWLKKMAEMPDIRVISVAHGAPITENCKTRLLQASDRL